MTDDTNHNEKEFEALLTKLRPFQKEAVDFAINRRRAGRILLADEMGLGKTPTSLAIALAFKSEWPLLILCPASLRFTWPAEIEKFYPKLPHSAVYVIRGFDDCDFYSNPVKKGRIKIVIATYSLLQNRSAAAKALHQFKFKCIIADESHNLKERKSQRCSIAMPLLSGAKRLILLSGTPALARPVELWAQLHCLDQDLFGSYGNYTKTYCNARKTRFGWDCKGLSNADELHKKLKSVMIRRLKCDVLKELPAKQRCIVPVQIQNSKHAQECRDIMSKLKESRLEMRSLVEEDDASKAHFEARSLLMQGYQASGIGKAQAVAEYVLDWLRGSDQQKVLVFGHHKDVLDVLETSLSKHLKGVGHIRIDGSTPPAERALYVKKFQTNRKVRVAILSVTAAGVGLTMTAASNVIFAELHWTPGVLAQAEDRCHRIGQTNAVNIMYCVCKEEALSVDLSLWSMLGRKVNALGKIIDGQKKNGMNAVDTENNAPSEEQLTEFFANTCPDIDNSGKEKRCVKGSIQSFFSKPTATSSISSEKGPLNTRKRAPLDATRGRNKPLQGSAAVASAVISCSKPFSWECQKCTFLNDTKSLSCEICGTTPVSYKCSLCKYAHKHMVSQCKNCLNHSQYIYTKPSAMTILNDRAIEILDTTANSFGSSKLHAVSPCLLPAKRCSKQSEVIDLVGDSEDEVIEVKRRKPNKVKSGTKENSSTTTEPKLLSFSASKNSGRVAIHSFKNGESLFVNFGLEQIIQESAGDDTRVGQLKRGTPLGIDASSVKFDDSAVKSVAKELCALNPYSSKQHFSSDAIDKLSSEIKTFTIDYVSLREVEKKAIQEVGAIPYDAVKDTLRKIFARKASVSKFSTERYAGGAKERAKKNVASGFGTEADEKVLNGDACAWCGGNKPYSSMRNGVESTYCSQECAEEGRLRRGGMYASNRIRAQVFSLEQGICQKCGIDANALFLRISALQPAERVNALINANWRLPKTQKALQILLKQPKESDFWQADHIVAVAEGGGNCGLDNLRTLCTPCHQVETERLRHRLKLMDRKLSKKKSIGRNESKSGDIRMLFAKQQRMKKKTSN